LRVDRSLVGTILIALLIATLVSFFIFGEKGGPYSVVKSEYASAGRNRFRVGLSVLVKKPISKLQFSYFCLVNRTDLIRGLARNATGRAMCEEIPNVRTFLDMAKAGFVEPEPRVFTAKIPLWETPDRLVEKEFQVYLYDFSRETWQAVPSEIMHSRNRPIFGRGHLWDFYDAFACMLDDTGNLTYFYQGVADFYLNKVVSIEELTIQRNDEKQVFVGRGEQSGPGSILYAPDRGVVLFEDLKRNDRIQILFSLDPTNTPSIDGKWPVGLSQIIHIVEITADGEAPQYIVNMVKPPKPVPKRV